MRTTTDRTMTSPGKRGTRFAAAGLLGVFVLLVSGSIPLAQEDPEQAEQAAAEADPAEGESETPEQTQVPPRAMTRSELQEAVEEKRRQFEDLMARIGDEPATPEQRARFQDLWTSITEMEAQLKKMDEERERQLKTEGRSFKDRWARLSAAAADFTNYDVNDGQFRIRIGIRLQVDATAGNQTQGIANAFGTIDTATHFRRFRVFAAGRILRRFDFDFEWDFGADPGVKDAWLEGVKYTKFLRWRIGRFREPFGLSRQTGSNFLSFLERPLPVAAFAPGRSWGVMLRHAELNERLHWAVSAASGGREDVDNQNTANLSFTGRVTGLPLFRDAGRRLLHLGLSYSARNPKGDSTQYQTQPEARFAPFYADTGPLGTDDAHLYAVELATVQGPFWVQVEWLGSSVNTTEFDELFFDGAYVEAGWFLTGESRFYRTQDGVFGRVAPNRLFKGGNPFTGKGEGGAIELTGRYSAVDLSDGAILGGQMTDVSLGINWYMTGTSRVMFNYIHSNVTDVGSANVFLLRYQFNPP
jgi:phosphate-selective porin OprO/OprP